jgi:hypothetical protein
LIMRLQNFTRYGRFRAIVSLDSSDPSSISKCFPETLRMRLRRSPNLKSVLDYPMETQQAEVSTHYVGDLGYDVNGILMQIQVWCAFLTMTWVRCSPSASIELASLFFSSCASVRAGIIQNRRAIPNRR